MKTTGGFLTQQLAALPGLCMVLGSSGAGVIRPVDMIEIDIDIDIGAAASVRRWFQP